MNVILNGQRAFRMKRSRRKKYDAVRSTADLAQALEFNSGAGDSRNSTAHCKWAETQQHGAIGAAQGKQESARTHAQFHSNAKALFAAGS